MSRPAGAPFTLPSPPPPPNTDHRSPITHLPASSPLQPSAFPWPVILLGEGPEREHLEQQVVALGLRNIVVRMPGFRPDADRAMGAFDLFIMPSRYEGFGLTLIEAMSHGLPVIASGADSLPELLEGYADGRIASFDPGHETEAAEAILQEISEAAQNSGDRSCGRTSPLAFIPSPIKSGEGAASTFHTPHSAFHTSSPLQPSASPWPFSAARMTADYLHLYESTLHE